MEWNPARNRVLRIDVYWYRRRPKRPRLRQLSAGAQKIARLEREQTIREIEEMRRRRERGLEA